MTAPRCGVIGLGNMGGGIAANLRAAQVLRAVWDANSAACARFPEAESGIAAVAGCDIVLLVVPGSAQIAALFDAGLLDGPPGRVLIDLTTSDPKATKLLAARAEAAGAEYLDAGMSGGAGGAASGKLTLMIGGSADTLARVRPVLDTIATRIFHVGPSGAGHTMKLVHNMICHTIFMATAEGCRAAERAGIPLESAIEVINAGNARSFVSERRFPDHILSGRFDGRSVTANLAKDLLQAKALFDALEQPSAYAGLTAALLQRALSAGMADQDFTCLYPAYDSLIDAL